MHAQRDDDRKTAAIAAQQARHDKGVLVQQFNLGREILKSSALKQAGLGGDQVVIDDPTHAPVFFLDGEHHRRKRSAIARFFTTTAVETRHRPFMERKADALLDELRQKGQICLDETAWLMAVAVASEIVGLNDNTDTASLARRIKGVLRQVEVHAMNPLVRFFMTPLLRLHVLHFHLRDVRTAIKARRQQRKDDIISHPSRRS
jgi:cytochrome P450